MKISVCITTFNEKQRDIDNLVKSLNSQTLKPNEIIIIDAKDYNNCSRSEGRNIAIKKAKNEVVAITDVGCIPKKDWIEKITKPLLKNKADAVAGGYEMVFKNKLQKAMSVFLGVSLKEMNDNFLPSARSMAFTKTMWKKAGGFPENLVDTAEDTVFNINLIKAGAKFVTVKEAVVSWQMPNSIRNFYLKIKNYARGDVISGIWWHPVKKFKTHNIKVLTIFARYLLLISLLYFGFINLFGILIIDYCLFAFKKAGLWGIPLQFVSDFAGIIGFSHGILQSSFKRN